MNAQDCINGLVQDAEEIYLLIDQGDYQEAASKWDCALGERQFVFYQQGIINGPHMGLMFATTAEMLRNDLYGGDPSKIRRTREMFMAAVAQMELPPSD